MHRWTTRRRPGAPRAGPGRIARRQQDPLRRQPRGLRPAPVRGAGPVARGRHPVAHPGQRQEPHHGLAREVDPASTCRTAGCSSSPTAPSWTSRSSGGGGGGGRRGHPPHPKRRRSRASARHRWRLVDRLPHPQVRRGRGRRPGARHPGLHEVCGEGLRRLRRGGRLPVDRGPSPERAASARTRAIRRVKKADDWRQPVQGAGSPQRRQGGSGTMRSRPGYSRSSRRKRDYRAPSPRREGGSGRGDPQEHRAPLRGRASAGRPSAGVRPASLRRGRHPARGRSRGLDGSAGSRRGSRVRSASPNASW